MNETQLGCEWDISYNSDLEEDVIFLDIGDDHLHLTKIDLKMMLEALD